jgi:hypothetical protein
VDVDLGFGVITFFGTLTVDEVIDSGGTALAIILAVFFDLTAIASIGSAVALVVFTLVTWVTSGSVTRRAPGRGC